MTAQHEIDPVVGDWDGSLTRYREQAVAAYTDLRDRIRKIATETLRRRDQWARSPLDGAVARAVAYQSVAGDLIRALDAVDRICPPLPEAREDAAPDDDRAQPRGSGPDGIVGFGHRGNFVVNVSSGVGAVNSPHHTLTDQEHAVITQAGELWNAICAAIPDGPTRDADLRELIAHIHAIQHAFMSNAAARRYPDLYRALGKTRG